MRVIGQNSVVCHQLFLPVFK